MDRLLDALMETNRLLTSGTRANASKALAVVRDALGMP